MLTDSFTFVFFFGFPDLISQPETHTHNHAHTRTQSLVHIYNNSFVSWAQVSFLFALFTAFPLFIHK